MERCLVTGANGHFGNTLVRELAGRGKLVRASVRDPENRAPFAGVSCEVVRADLLDKRQALAAMENVDVCIHAAAVFRHWAPEPEKDIVEANNIITRNVLQAVAERGVRRLIYVSSIAALDQEQAEMREDMWNPKFIDYYYKSKTLSERLAWKLAGELGVDMVSVLPAGMVGPNTYGTLSDTMTALNLVLMNAFPLDPNYGLHIVDVRDVAAATVDAVERGRRGERYILGTEVPLMTGEFFDIARLISPQVKKRSKASRCTMLFLAWLTGLVGRVTRSKPLVLRSQVELYYGTTSRLDISKARRELGFDPKPARQALLEAFQHLHHKALPAQA